MTKVNVGGKEFYLDEKLRQKLELTKEMLKKNWDIMFIIDGKERSGKSTLAFTCGWYLSDGKITPDNIIIDIADCIQKIERLPPKSVLIIDEGVLLFLARDTMTAESKTLSKILMICGQKNLVLIVCIPSYFELSKYIATTRARCLLHVYTKGFERGRFMYWGTKKLTALYTEGKQHYNSYKKPSSTFKGRFTIFEPPFHEEYLRIKNKTLQTALSVELAGGKPKESKDKLVINEMRKLQKKSWLTVLKELNKVSPALTIKQKAQILSMSERNLRRYKDDLMILDTNQSENDDFTKEKAVFEADKRPSTFIPLKDGEDKKNNGGKDVKP